MASVDCSSNGSIFISTLNLVSTLVSLTNHVVFVIFKYMLGILCGSPILGALSDQWGRKKTILISTIIFTLAGPLVAAAPNLWLLMVARFILAAASPGIYGTSFVLGNYVMHIYVHG